MSTHPTAWERMSSREGRSDGVGRSKGGRRRASGAGREAATNREAENRGVRSSACYHPFDTVVGKYFWVIARICNGERKGKSRGPTVGSEKLEYFGRTPSIFSSEPVWKGNLKSPRTVIFDGNNVRGVPRSRRGPLVTCRSGASMAARHLAQRNRGEHDPLRIRSD